MNRRAFIKRIATGVAAGIALAHIPPEWVPRYAGVRDYVALNYLRQEYNNWLLGRGPGTGGSNDVITVGRDLYEAAEAELIHNSRVVFGHGGLFMRNIKRDNLAFKGAVLIYEGRGWRLISIERHKDLSILERA
mgnify:CR=1 FL=1